MKQFCVLDFYGCFSNFFHFVIKSFLDEIDLLSLDVLSEHVDFLHFIADSLIFDACFHFFEDAASFDIHVVAIVDLALELLYGYLSFLCFFLIFLIEDGS